MPIGKNKDHTLITPSFLRIYYSKGIPFFYLAHNQCNTSSVCHPFCITKTYWTGLFARLALQRNLATGWIMPLISSLLFTETESTARTSGTGIILTADTVVFQKAIFTFFFSIKFIKYSPPITTLCQFLYWRLAHTLNTSAAPNRSLKHTSLEGQATQTYKHSTWIFLTNFFQYSLCLLQVTFNESNLNIFHILQ